MTRLTRVLSGLSSLLFLAPLFAGGCGSSPGRCLENDSCVALGYALIYLPSSFAQASATAPCTISADGTDLVRVTRDSVGSCQVRIQLADGKTYSSSANFTQGGICCPDLYYGVAGPLDPIDAGSGGD